MSRPGIWRMVWIHFKKSLGARGMKKYVGEDGFGNRYYELEGGRKNVTRGYDPSVTSTGVPSLEWVSWLRGTRRFPPSDEEIQVNAMKQQEQLAEDAKVEKNAPRVGSSGGSRSSAHSIPFPRYRDFEDRPGVTKHQ